MIPAANTVQAIQPLPSLGTRPNAHALQDLGNSLCEASCHESLSPWQVFFLPWTAEALQAYNWSRAYPGLCSRCCQ